MDLLFTSIPLGDTKDFVLDEIYDGKKLEPFCKNLVFKKLFKKLCKGCTIFADGRLIRQVNGCGMGGLISVAVSNTFCVKMGFAIQNFINVMLMIFIVNGSRINHINLLIIT